MIRQNVSNMTYVNTVTVDMNVFSYKAMLTLYQIDFAPAEKP